jgi:methionyl-tRNA formyltransferase
MNIVLWINDQANQKALANKLHNAFGLNLIVVESKTPQRRNAISFLKKIAGFLLFKPLTKSWENMLAFYNGKYASYPEVKIVRTTNLNSEEVYKATLTVNPALVIVSGTTLVKQKLLSLKPTIGILNLHTGLSPYVNGGPNCTNWCLALNQFHLIGNTVMWIDAGIDSGNIISTELTPFNGSESLTSVHIKVMEHAQDLYLRAVKEVLAGKRNSVPQHDIATGKTFYNKQWGFSQKHDAIKNFKKFKQVVTSAEYKKKQESLKTIKL